MNRRAFLKTIGLTTLAMSTGALAKRPKRLKYTDPKCPPDAFKETYEELRKLQGLSDNLTPEQRLANARAWLGGSPDFKPKLSRMGRWMKVRYEGGHVPIRVLQPRKSRGVVLSIHGGGWTMGAATSDEKFNERLAKRHGVTVVSPDYRLAPEHPYPAAPDDCEAVALWLLKNGERCFRTPRLAIIGFSAGAHLAALTLTRLSASSRRRFSKAVFFYGVFNLERSPRWREGKDGDFPDLTPSAMNLSLKSFTPGLSDEERASGLYSPLNANLDYMPPALFLAGSSDMLYPDTLAMAKMWARSGNQAELVTYQGAPHGFNGYNVDCGLDPNEYARRFLQFTNS